MSPHKQIENNIFKAMAAPVFPLCLWYSDFFLVRPVNYHGRPYPLDNQPKVTGPDLAAVHDLQGQTQK